MGPPLRFTREAPTERLRGEPRRCGRCGGLSYKNWETTSTRAHSPQRGDATHRHRPEKRTSASSKGIWVYGCDWRASQDVPDRGGAPNNGECLQGKTDTSVVDVPAEGHLPHLVIEDRRTDGRTEVCPTVVCSSDSYLPGCSSFFLVRWWQGKQKSWIVVCGGPTEGWKALFLKEAGAVGVDFSCLDQPGGWSWGSPSPLDSDYWENVSTGTRVPKPDSSPKGQLRFLSCQESTHIVGTDSYC